MSLIELAERVEKASGPDRALDDAIAAELFRFAGMSQLKGVPDDQQFRTFSYPNGSIGSSLRYSASLDAAMSLVPEGVGWSIGFGMVPGLGDAPQLFVALQDGPDMRAYAGYATPALALCAAALRARAQQTGESQS